jgi:hypothetical protein
VPAGYSGTPTARKLGIEAGLRVTVLNAPGDYRRLVDGLPTDLELRASLRGKSDVVHVFVTRQVDLERRIRALRSAIEPDGALWVSWPKRASKIATDVTEDTIRRVALANRLVVVKVCAVDATWSGLKLVIPVAQRRS